MRRFFVVGLVGGNNDGKFVMPSLWLVTCRHDHSVLDPRTIIRPWSYLWWWWGRDWCGVGVRLAFTRLSSRGETAAMCSLFGGTKSLS